MGKDEKKNKQHHKRKDRKHKKERSKKEHYLRKDREQDEQERKETEENRYRLTDKELQKLIKILRELFSYKNETQEAVLEVFELLDSNQELDITDIEDGQIRESLERIFMILEKQISKTEDNDGRFQFSKSGNRSLKEQIENYIAKAKSAPNLDHISDLLSSKLEKEMTVREITAKNIHVSDLDDKRIRTEIMEYEEQHRTKSLMEMHLEKRKDKKNIGNAGKYLFGEKTLQKRFGQGKFLK
jgi:hypothetical protein